MRQQFRFLGAITVAGIAAGGLSACGLAASESFSDDDVLKDKITSVRLDSRSGGITLRGQDGAGQVSLQRKVDYKGDKPGGKTYRVEDGVLVLGGCGKDCSVNYTVDLPAGLPVTGKTSSGRITLSRVGAVTVGTSSGAVNLDDVAGAVDVHTTNGRITGTGLKGDGIKARTSNGKINLTPAKAQDVRAKTSNGAITLTVPDGRYKVTAKTNNGSKDIGVSNDPNGQYQLDLTTSNGAITVKSA